MKRVFVVLMMFVLSGFVLAASSEAVADFSVNVPQEVSVSDYDSSEPVADDLFGYSVLLIIALLIAYFIFKKKKKVSRKVKKKK